MATLTACLIVALALGPRGPARVGSIAHPAARQTPTQVPAPAKIPGTISGVVVEDGAAGATVARAVVVLRGTELQPAIQLVADDAGRFAFGALPAGSFTITASKAGYLTMAYGQQTPGQGSGLPLALTVGQQLTNLRLVLPRASAISGRVQDEAGQPVENAPIIVGQYRSISGERTLVSAGALTRNTDNHGAYRIYGLAPGEYIVCAFRPGDFLGLPQNCNAGAGESVRETTTSEVQWAMQQIRDGSSGGARDTVVAGRSPAPPLGQAVSYGSTFHPQSTTAAGALPVTVGRGEERTGIDIVMLRRPVGRIDATIVGVDGRPAVGATVRFSDGFGMSSRSTPDGRFSTSGLWPGRYTLSARAGDAVAATDIDIAGGDAKDVVLRLQPAGVTTASFGGRVTFDAASLTPPPAPTSVRISLVGSPPTGLLAAMVNADGTFTISGIDPGRYRVQASMGGQASPGPTWQLKAAMLRGQDVSDSFFEVAAGQGIADAVVTFTDHPSELSGTLQDALGRPAGGFYVVVFSTDKTFWRQGARRLPPPARSATDGRFRFANLPAGTYHLVALTDVNQTDLYDDTFLTSLLPGSIDVTIADGEKKVQDVRLGRTGN